MIPEIHVIPFEVQRGGAEAAALHQLVGLASQSFLDVLPRDACKEALTIDAKLAADFSEHVVPRNVLIVSPVRLEQCASEWNELAIRLEQDAAAHRFDAVN